MGTRRRTADLAAAIHGLDRSADARARERLAQCAHAPLPAGRALVRHAASLLFIAAHPTSRELLRAVHAEQDRIARALAARPKAGLDNTGLPHTRTVAPFTADLVAWLMTRPDVALTLASRIGRRPGPWHDVLAQTLPALEREWTTVGAGDRELLDELIGRRADPVRFLCGEFGRLKLPAPVADALWERLGVEFALAPQDPRISLAGNRLALGPPFFHRGRATGAEAEARVLVARALPRPRPLTPRTRAGVLDACRWALALRQRETDPATYADPATVRVYALERGMSVALYAPRADRQLPLESYVGYTAFKNGYPCAYGGAWVFGRRALFGINVFEEFRGGESGVLLGQLLRTYRQSFGVGRFEVEPYQFGAGNEDGLRSGAFWFYYRHGFRPVDAPLARLAAREARRRAADPDHRSSLATLRTLATGNVELILDARPAPRVADVRERITRLIRDRFGGDRARAAAALVPAFRRATGTAGPRDAAGAAVELDLALWRAVAGRVGARRLSSLRAMLRDKPRDPWRYQRQLLAFLD
jgi:hypothetical protein